jgi:hypothetical protein
VNPIDQKDEQFSTDRERKDWQNLSDDGSGMFFQAGIALNGFPSRRWSWACRRASERQMKCAGEAALQAAEKPTSTVILRSQQATKNLHWLENSNADPSSVG